MAPKRKGRRGKNRAKVQQIEKLEEDLIEFENFVEIKIEEMKLEEETLIQKIINQYDCQLKQIPNTFQNMTLKEIEDLIHKTPNGKETSPYEDASALNVVMDKLKSMRKNRTLSSKPKKKMVTVMPNIKEHSTISGLRKGASADFSLKAPISKAGCSTGSTYLPYKCTPIVRSAFGNRQKHPFIKKSIAVTPKFDPRTPLISSVLRKPKVGETIMSLSGSPLQNTASNPEKPSVLLSLPDGKVINILEPSELVKIKDLQLDQETKAALLSAQQKLAGIID